MTTRDQALRSYYMALFQLPLLPERLLLSRGGTPIRRMLRGGGLSKEAAGRYVARMEEMLARPEIYLTNRVNA